MNIISLPGTSLHITSLSICHSSAYYPTVIPLHSTPMSLPSWNSSAYYPTVIPFYLALLCSLRITPLTPYLALFCVLLSCHYQPNPSLPGIPPHLEIHLTCHYSLPGTPFYLALLLT